MSSSALALIRDTFQANWNLEMLVFEEGKTGVPWEKLPLRLSKRQSSQQFTLTRTITLYQLNMTKIAEKQIAKFLSR